MTLAWTAKPGQMLEVDGVALEYACFGQPPGTLPTLVMLHEGLGCVALWRDVPQQLAAATGLGVFVYSRQGYGQSDSIGLPRPLDYMTREAEDVLGAVLNAAGMRDVILLGHSDGATIASIYAGSVSDMRVRGLILIAPHFFTEPTGLAAIRAAGQAFASGDMRHRLARHHKNVDAAFRGWHDAWTDPAFESWNVADAIDHLRVPVLAIQGRDDPYGTLAQLEEIDTRIYAPFESVILDNCGHAPHFEQPESTRDAIAEFCARLVRLEQENVALT
ncbi:alpha/beta hydrolase [Roseobacter sp. YSTF-M11]|uniref:Alpha/beta hydrolase n=1 Tax=Roseobacter insulae TaxID=2859783 RepID=A0A9X1K1K6_9RHOB|nr:alpha/beta hydrolase [Roseobacter insulae]MBW4709319.1 alpha/beta hydrolase [Roseobacter insulae]